MTKEELRTTIADIVTEITAGKVEKSMPEALDENGGKDKIKSGSPFTEQGEGSPAKTDESHCKDKKKVEKSEEDETPEEDKVEKGCMKKSDEDKDKKEDKKKKDDKDMKKSEDTSENTSEDLNRGLGELSKEEVELVKSWREDAAKDAEEISKSLESDSKTEDLMKAQKEENDSLRKALSDQSELIKSLSDKIEKISSQPAYDKKSLDKLEPVEKSNGNTLEISPNQIRDRLLELQVAGKGVNSKHVAEFEATRNISDINIKNLVMDSFKN